MTADVIWHIEERHGPTGDAESNFDFHFLTRIGGYGLLVKTILDRGVSAPEYDNSGRLIYKYYHNFMEKTGTGKDKDGNFVTYKGAEMVGTQSDLVFYVETAYPKGILKE